MTSSKTQKNHIFLAIDAATVFAKRQW